MSLELINPAELPTPENYTQVVAGSGSRRPEYLPLIAEARRAVFGDHKPADTFLGIEALAEPGYLIEVETIAVID